MEVLKYVKHRKRLKDNLEKSYTLMIGKSTELNCMQLKGLQDWEATNDISDGIKILKTIKSLLHQALEYKCHPLSLCSAIKIEYYLQQEPVMMNAQLVDRLKDRVEVVEEIGGSIGADPKLIVDELAAYFKDIGVNT